MASGLGFVIGYYQMNVFGEAASSPAGVIEVDFLNGKITQGEASASLAKAASLYAAALPDFCKRHRADVGDFKRLSARFSRDPLGPRFSVTTTSQSGRSVTTDYFGVPGARARILDGLGRLRPKPVQISQTARS